MQNAEIEKLQREIERLNNELGAVRHQVIEIWKTITQESTNTTESLSELHRDVRFMLEYLWPVVDKLFPNLRADQKDLSELLNKLGKGGNKKN